MRYLSFDSIVKTLLAHGRGALMAKEDLTDAFKFIRVRQEDWPLLGSTWVGRDGVRRYFMDTVLPFGLRSSPKLFDQFAEAVCFLARKRGCSIVEHYLDDYLTIGPRDSPVCRDNLDILHDACIDIGFQTNPDKRVAPTTKIEFLGIEIDSNTMELRISQERLRDIRSELESWMGKLRATKRQLLSIAGKLAFVSKVVRHGRSFIRHIYDCAGRLSHLGHRTRLSAGVKADIAWWLGALPRFNGVSVIKSLETGAVLWSDSSSFAFGATDGSRWIQGEFTKSEAKKHINWKEMYALLCAILSWADTLRNKAVVVYCDNSAVVGIVNSGTTPSKPIMALVRLLCHVCVQFDLFIEARLLPTSQNSSADALSRLRNSEFFHLNPTAENTPLNLVRPTSF